MAQNDNNKRFVRNSDLLSVEMDGELVMMSIDTGKYFGVSGVGPRTWELLESPRTLNELVEIICAEYEVDADTAAADLGNFISRLADNGMLQDEAGSYKNI